jgi:hypothetical protein
MPAKSKPQTLEERINQAVARHQFTFDPIDSPDQHIRCAWCDGSLLIDYFTFGVPEMTRMLTNWVKEHATCEPKLQTKTGAMMLTPREKKAV